jgi:hypothetical protein
MSELAVAALLALCAHRAIKRKALRTSFDNPGHFAQGGVPDPFVRRSPILLIDFWPDYWDTIDQCNVTGACAYRKRPLPNCGDLAYSPRRTLFAG